MTHVLAIDQGTTSTRAIVFDASMKAVSSAQKDLKQFFPQNGWVEHNPTEIWESTVATCKEAIEKLGGVDIVAIGLTNQRETTLVWDRITGEPIYNAIVWQDRRTSNMCEALKADDFEQVVTSQTGLLLDPYFSATKISWLLKNVEGARARAEAGELVFGTVDSWLIWNLTGGHNHATDATNAARTMLYDIHMGCWSAEICDRLKIPMSMLPQVHDCAANFGETLSVIFGTKIPILGVAGDQQSATVGQACFKPGMLKSTYGTGCFALINTGNVAVRSRNRLLTTIAYQLNGKPTYALEGSIFIAGAVVQWLRDELKLISDAKEAQTLAEMADPSQSVVMVPAFTGLGAPYWQASCRGAIFGLTRNSGPSELAQAALESVGYQTKDLLAAMHADLGEDIEAVLRVDGGMSASDYTMQFIADIIGARVDRPKNLETTALGAAWLAGNRAGIYPDLDEFAATWDLECSFEPRLGTEERDKKYATWQRAVSATLDF